jgi:hypothetical protein
MKSKRGLEEIKALRRMNLNPSLYPPKAISSAIADFIRDGGFIPSQDGFN